MSWSFSWKKNQVKMMLLTRSKVHRKPSALILRRANNTAPMGNMTTCGENNSLVKCFKLQNTGFYLNNLRNTVWNTVYRFLALHVWSKSWQMRSSLVVRAAKANIATTLGQIQHPRTQWNLRGGRLCSVEYFTWVIWKTKNQFLTQRNVPNYQT